MLKSNLLFLCFNHLINGEIIFSQVKEYSEKAEITAAPGGGGGAPAAAAPAAAPAKAAAPEKKAGPPAKKGPPKKGPAKKAAEGGVRISLFI